MLGGRDEKIKLLHVNNNVEIRWRDEVVFNALEPSCQHLLLTTYNLSSPTLLYCYAGTVF
jgi:hypothetical protein